MKAPWAIVAALVGVLVLGLVAHRRGASLEAPVERAASHDASEASEGKSRVTLAAADGPDVEPDAAAGGELPRSLRGTRVAGELRTDADGHFLPGPEALLLFDYYLSAANELSVEALTARIQGAIRERLSPPADAEAEAFLADYLDYLAAGDSEFRGPGVAESADLEQRLQWNRELRREHFGAELAEHLFGDQERAAEIHLERRRLQADPDLDPADRAERLAQLEERYPEAQRAARARATAPLRHAREEADLRASGASEVEIHALREERFGAEAAERMQALDQERTRWAARLAAYRVERDRRLAEAADAAEGERQVEALLRESFSEGEARRVRHLDAAEALGEPASPGAP